MSYFSIVCIVIAVICLFVGIYTLTINSRSTENRFFLTICVWIAVLNLLAVKAYSSTTKEEFVLWTHFVTFFTHTFFPLNLHFYIYLLRKTKPPLSLIALVYGPPLLLMSVPLSNYRNYYDFKYIEGQWKWIPETESMWLYIFLFFLVLYTTLTIVYIIKYVKNSKFNRERKQAGLLIVNYAVAIAAGIVIVGIVPAFYPDIQNIGPSYSLFYILGLFFAVFKYKFLTFKTSFVAEEIIAHISDIVILIDRDCNIVHYNRKFSEYFMLNMENLKETNISKIIGEGRNFKYGMDQLISGDISRFYCRLDYCSGRDTIPTDTYVSKITDRFHDISGFIIISKINKGRNLFRKTYGITDREFEVIDLVLSGLSNEQVGKKLGISERTVEAHCLHIYNKTGVKDRMDLFRISIEYGLVPEQYPS